MGPKVFLVWLASVCAFEYACADSILLVPKFEPTESHCLQGTAKGYVSSFDGEAFEVYTLLIDCEGRRLTPPRCEPLIVPKDQAPTELRTAMGGRDFQLVRNLIPSTEIVSISFDQSLYVGCKAPKFIPEREPGPIRRPTSLGSLSSGELKTIESYKDKHFEGKLISMDWKSVAEGPKAIKTGDIIQISNDAFLGFGRSVDPNSKVTIAGTRSASDRSFEYIFVSGMLAGFSVALIPIQLHSR